MKIYQLHERGGEWEDYYDYIRGSFLRKESAIEEKIKAEVRQKEEIKQGHKCYHCPFIDEDFSEMRNLLLSYPNYCTQVKLEDCDGEIMCENYYIKFCESHFDIEEVEVEE